MKGLLGTVVQRYRMRRPIHSALDTYSVSRTESMLYEHVGYGLGKDKVRNIHNA